MGEDSGQPAHACSLNSLRCSYVPTMASVLIKEQQVKTMATLARGAG